MKKLKFVLLIDDDAVSNYLSEIILREMNIAESFKVVNNGLEGLQYLKDIEGTHAAFNKLIPELILLDLNMPVLNGIEFLDFYNRMDFKAKERIKIVVLTSTNYQADVQTAIKLGAVCSLEKPLSSEKISSVIEKLF